MTNYNNTDRIIKEKYESMDPVFDAESMWTDISPVIEKKRRRGFFFWTFAGSIVIMLSLLSSNLFNQNENPTSEVGIFNDEKASSNGTDVITDIINLPMQSFEKVNIESIAEVGDDSNWKNTDNSSKAVEKSSIVNYISRDEPIDIHNGNVISLENKIANPSINETSISYLNSVEENKANNITAIVDLAKGSRALVFMSVLPSLNVLSLDYASDKVVPDAPEMIGSFYTQPLQKNQWRLGINGGYYIHSRSFDNVGGDVSDNFKNRSEEEKAKDGYDLGIKVEYFLSDHFVILGGARFSQSFVQRKADYAYTETITLLDQVVEITITEQGPVEEIADVTYDGVFVHKADNYITATRLGLIGGLQYRIGADRWTTHVDLGVELPVWSSHSGIITNDRRPYNLSDGTEIINTSSLQIFGGIGMEYFLSESTALQATIGGYMPLNNEHEESYAIEKKSTLLGLNLGVHFRL